MSVVTTVGAMVLTEADDGEADDGDANEGPEQDEADEAPGSEVADD